MAQISILACGGTLDKDYDPLTGELVFGHTHLTELLDQANHTLRVALQEIMLKDSLTATCSTKPV
jgi:L-asparaginase